jgi:hypothetical protein
MMKFLISMVVVSSTFPEVIAREQSPLDEVCIDGHCPRRVSPPTPAVDKPPPVIIAVPPTPNPTPAEPSSGNPNSIKPSLPPQPTRSVLVRREQSRVGFVRRFLRSILKR